MGFELTDTIIWIGIAVFFGVIEILTVGLTTIWFAAAAVLAVIAAEIGLSVLWQTVIFLASSCILLYFTRPLAVKYLKIGKEKTNAALLIGKTGIVIEDIKPYNSGLVKVSGQIWTAKATDESIEIKSDSRVKIVKIEGVKLIVNVEK